MTMADHKRLDALFEAAKLWWRNATPEQKDEMLRKQRESWIRAEKSWPEPKYKMVNGCKIYNSYGDYVND